MPHVPKPAEPKSAKREPARPESAKPGSTKPESARVERQAPTPDERSAEQDAMNDSMAGFDQESVDLSNVPDLEYEFSMGELYDAELRKAIRAIELPDDEEMLPRVEIRGAEGQHSALMRIDHPVKLRVRGSLGDYAFAHNAQTVVKVFGNVGHGVAEGMTSGSVRIRGHAGHGAGTAMSGGTLGIYGSAGDRAGGAMRGGGLFIRGSVGNDVGLGALGGTIVIGGDAGRNLGDPLSDVSVFIRGKAESLSEGVTECPLRKKQEVQLGLLLISAGIRGDATDFRRIVPLAKLAAERAAHGEVVPNWR